jgi:hypothetical protein
MSLLFNACGGSDEADEADRHRHRDAGTTVYATVTACPAITRFDVAPLQTGLGGAVQLTAEALEGSVAGASFTWIASAGRVTVPNRATTSYTCTAPGRVLLTLRVSNRLGCTETRSASITCAGR